MEKTGVTRVEVQTGQDEVRVEVIMTILQA
jgi:hypothetical protein